MSVNRMSESTTISEADLTRLLPTCQRCRRLRRKCDTQLPACRLCQKGKTECTFFDHALQQTLPRSYVDSLLNRLNRLRSVQTALQGNAEPLSSIEIRAPHHVRNISSVSTQPEVPPNEWGTYTSELSFDKHFIIGNANPTCWQFFGSSSAYALAVEVLVHAQAKLGTVTHPENYAGPEFWFNSTQSSDLPDGIRARHAPNRDEVEMLHALYMTTTNTLMSFINPDESAADIDLYLQQQGTDTTLLTGKEAHQFFKTSMICAIASANKARHELSFAAKSMGYYDEAVQCVEEVTSDVTSDALQALMLLIMFALFYPRKGDTWKLLDFACRLSVELNYHTEPNDAYEDEKNRRRRRTTFWGLYCIERTMGQHFGRPSDLPEEIITAEYPATLTDITNTNTSNFQYILTSHYYRLTYLRSEIFRELYLPVTAPNLPRMWYEHKLDQILNWRRELQFFDSQLGMGSLTCDMGFDTSVCFLFQPLLLRALAATKEPMLSSPITTTNTSSPTNTNFVQQQQQHQPDLLIPRESYHSACKVVDFYNKIFRGADSTQYGMYPITVISAHYVHQATLTILSHCLLAIDGRLPVVTFSRELSGDNVLEGQQIDFHGIYEISSNCLILLNILAKRWPGMVGVLDIYKNLSDRVLPIMVRSGLA